MGSYVPTSPAERAEMLKSIGVESVRDLYSNVPADMLLEEGALNLPEGCSELEVSAKMNAIADKEEKKRAKADKKDEQLENKVSKKAAKSAKNAKKEDR